MENVMRLLGIMSVQAAIVLIVVFIVRKLFEKIRIEKKYMMILWAIPFFFLVFPWKLTLSKGFWQTAPAEVIVVKEAEVETESPVVAEDEDGIDVWYGSGSAQLFSQQMEQTAGFFDEPEQEKKLLERVGEIFTDNSEIFNILGIIWGAGLVVILIGNIISCLRMKKKLVCSIETGERVFEGDDVEGPMTVGVIRPRIYLPVGICEEDKKHILAHEMTHIKRHDPLYKFIVYLITCIYWFNPLVWVGFYLFSRDMEMACDEETLRTLGEEEKESYVKVLLDTASGKIRKKRIIFAAPIAFEAGDIKSRMKNIMSYKKTIFILSAAAIVICGMIGAVFMTAAESIPETLDEMDYYKAFIRQIEEAAADDFKTVSTEELGISEVFKNGLLMVFNQAAYGYVVDYGYTYGAWLGYNFVDLDKDGIFELLFAVDDKYLEESPIYDIYTFKDGKICRLAEGTQSSCFYLCEDNHIINAYWDINDEGYQAEYSLENGQWKFLGSLLYDGSYHYNKKEISIEGAKAIDEDTGWKLRNNRTYKTMRYTRFRTEEDD